jgi:hypothetical protein
MSQGLNSEILREYLEYNDTTGIFTYKITRSNKLAGSTAGSTDTNGYIMISINNCKFLAHRLAWLYIYGQWPDSDLDHIDGNRTNNSINNLRKATRSQNNYNKTSNRNKNNYRGVCKTSSGKFSASIKVIGRDVYIGNFMTAEEASLAYEDKAREIQKEFYKDPGYTYSITTYTPIIQKSSTGFTGVRKSGSKFKAVIKINGINVHIGTYATPEEASTAFEAKKKEIGRK